MRAGQPLPIELEPERLVAFAHELPTEQRLPVGFFTVGGPMANDAGLSALTGPRSLDEAKKRIAAAGYKGERIVMVAPTDIPAIWAMSTVMADRLTKMGLNIDLQSMDWGTMISRMAKKDAIDQGGWNLFCVTWAGLTGTPSGVSTGWTVDSPVFSPMTLPSPVGFGFGFGLGGAFGASVTGRSSRGKRAPLHALKASRPAGSSSERAGREFCAERWGNS